MAQPRERRAGVGRPQIARRQHHAPMRRIEYHASRTLVWCVGHRSSRTLPKTLRAVKCFGRASWVLSFTPPRAVTPKISFTSASSSLACHSPHHARVVFGSWSPDAREVATCSEDGTACVWDVSPVQASLADLQLQDEVATSSWVVRVLAEGGADLDEGFPNTPLQARFAPRFCGSSGRKRKVKVLRTRSRQTPPEGERFILEKSVTAALAR